MNKTVVLYVAHEINNYTLFNYNHIKDGLLDNFELLWCINDSNSEYKKYKNINFYVFNYNDISKHDDVYPNVPEIIFNDFNFFSKYNYYWVIEYDVLYLGDYKELFNSYNNENIDFISSHVYDIHSWWHYFKFKDNDLYTLTSFNTICRLSKRLVQTVINQKYVNIKESFYETYLPSICVKENLKIKSFDYDLIKYNIYKINDNEYNINIINELYNDINKYKNKIIHPIKKLNRKQIHKISELYLWKI